MLMMMMTMLLFMLGEDVLFALVFLFF